MPNAGAEFPRPECQCQPNEGAEFLGLSAIYITYGMVSSNTEPLLRLNLEANDEATLAAAVEELGAQLGTPSEH